MRLGKLDGFINNTWQVAYDSGELAAAVASVTISGLLGNTDEEYQLICRFVDDDTAGGYYLRFNNDSGNNYGYQYIKGSNTDATAVRDTSEAQIDLGYTNTDGNICFSKHLIYAKSGYLRTVISKSAEDITTTTVTNIKQIGQVWNNTADEITSMVIGALNDKMNIGTRIILLKKVKITTGLKTGSLNVQGGMKGNWQKIYETTLTEAATSHTISGLDGNTDVLYRLRIRAKNAYNGQSIYWLRPNNDTGANYGYQALQGNNATAQAIRETAITGMRLIGCSALNYLGFIEFLLYAKSGYLRTALSSFGDSITGTTVNWVVEQGTVWNNTADNITSLVILSDQTNGLGIGTYICLERLIL